DKGARDPNVAGGSGGNGTRRIYSAKLSDHSARRDPAEFVHCLLGKPHVTIRARGDVARERIRCRCRELRKNAGLEIVPPNGMIGLISKPNIAIRAGGDTHADPEEGELELNDRGPSCRASCDRCNLPCGPFAEPDVAVGARSDESWIAQGRGNEVSKLAMGSDAGDQIAIGKSEPKITIRPHRNPEGLRALPIGEALEVRWCVARRQRLRGGGA